MVKTGKFNAMLNERLIRFTEKTDEPSRHRMPSLYTTLELAL